MNSPIAITSNETRTHNFDVYITGNDFSTSFPRVVVDAFGITRREIPGAFTDTFNGLNQLRWSFQPKIGSIFSPDDLIRYADSILPAEKIIDTLEEYEERVRSLAGENGSRDHVRLHAMSLIALGMFEARVFYKEHFLPNNDLCHIGGDVLRGINVKKADISQLIQSGEFNYINGIFDEALKETIRTKDAEILAKLLNYMSIWHLEFEPVQSLLEAYWAYKISRLNKRKVNDGSVLAAHNVFKAGSKISGVDLIGFLARSAVFDPDFIVCLLQNTKK